LTVPPSNTEHPIDTVYVRLLDEGTEVFRPVPAVILPGSKCVLKGEEIFAQGDEKWEFLPGTTVRIEERKLSGSVVLVAVEAA
jgi:hypothetical protein